MFKILVFNNKRVEKERSLGSLLFGVSLNKEPFEMGKTQDYILEATNIIVTPLQDVDFWHETIRFLGKLSKIRPQI